MISVLVINLICAAAFADELPGAEKSEEFVPGYTAGDYSGFETPALRSAGTSSSGFLRGGEETSLPALYSSVTEGRIREETLDQHPYGTCWAFALTSVAEVTLRENEELNYYPRLSVLQEVAFCYQAPDDPLGNTAGDSITINYPAGTNALTLGGTDTHAMISMSQWDNGAPESVLPYKEPYLTAVGNGTLDSSYNFTYDEAHLKDFHFLNTEGLDTADEVAAVKELVLEFGAATLAYCHNTSYANATYGSYCCTDATAHPNHLVTIVGWNDSYPKENFGSGEETPESDGAWLIKNSWGDYQYSTTSDPEDTGEATDRQGYFWLSYFDKTITPAFAVPEFEAVDRYQHNYMYDGTISCGDPVEVLPGASVGALYEVKGLTADREKVDGISFITGSADLTVELKVIAGTSESDPLGAAGQQVYTKTYSAKYPGVHTIEIDGPVLGKGEYYTILLTFPEGGNIFVDKDITMEDGVVVCDADCSNDLTFDCAPESDEANFRTDMTYRIKGFTNDSCRVDLQVRSRIKGTDRALIPVAGSGQLERNGTAVLTAPDAPEGFQFDGWYLNYSAASSVPVTTEKALSVTASAGNDGKTLYYTAVYSVDKSASLAISVAADECIAALDGGAGTSLSGTQTVNAKPGGEVTLTYSGDESFLYWEDASGNRLTGCRTCRFTAVRATELHAVTVENRTDGSTCGALVCFERADGSLISAKYCWNNEAFSLPDTPAGQEAWGMTVSEIKAAMKDSDVIHVRPQKYTPPV